MDARKRIVTCFTKMIGSYCAATPAAQKNFQEMEGESQNFIEMMKEKIVELEYDPCNIINMDHSPTHIHIIQAEYLK
jgi:hypothetical protein